MWPFVSELPKRMDQVVHHVFVVHVTMGNTEPIARSWLKMSQGKRTIGQDQRQRLFSGAWSAVFVKMCFSLGIHASVRVYKRHFGCFLHGIERNR